MSTKHCYRCKETRPITEFHHHATNYDRRQGYCKSCKRDAAKRPRIPKEKPRICLECASLSHRVKGRQCPTCGLRFAEA